MMERALIEYVINALWQVPLLAGGAWLLLRMVRPAPLIQHHVWLAVLGLAVLLPVHGMDFRGVSATQHTGTVIEASHEEVLVALAQNELPPRRGQSSVFGTLFSARTGNLRLTTRTAHWLLRLYVATIVIGLFRITRAWLGARTLVQNSQETCLDDRDRTVLEDYSHRLGIKPPQLRESGEVSSPMIVGMRAPVLLLPAGFARHTENEIRAALCHELAHIQRRDYVLNVACQVAALPLAWHPGVDWVQQRIHMTREMVCDAMAAQEMKSHLGYAKCLLALAHSMLGERGMAAQEQFLGLFGNHTLEERVMRLMDTTTMSVRAKAARVVSGAAMMIATGVIAGMFHVTPTMAQANVPPQATQNPPAEAQAPVPEPKASSPSAAVHGDTTPAVPKKRTYIHRNGGDGEGRESTLTEQPLIDRDVQQRIDDIARQMAEATAKFNSPEFQQRMDDLARQMAAETAKVNSAEFKQRMDDLRRQMADVGPKINSPEFKQQMDDMRRQMADVGPQVNSPEFKQQMDDMRRQMADVGPKVNSPEFKQQMDDLRRQMAEVGPKINSPEFQQRMDDLQKEMQKQMEEFSREYPHSPNP
jgi:beta-lactamase regulating signal transducer with metallopeptidase domain/polyhydroxyalkanoate synthesis regulator phasin